MALMEVRVRRPAELFRIVGALDVGEKVDTEWFLLTHPQYQQIWFVAITWEQSRIKTMELVTLAALQSGHYDPPAAVLRLLDGWLEHFLASSSQDNEVDEAKSA